MTLSSIQGRLGLLLAGFALLVASAVGVTFWGIEAQSNDARLINLAGRQRMLVQQMTRLSLQIKISNDQQAKSELLDAGQTFEQTLDAMQFGGQASYLPGQFTNVPAARDATVLQQLQQLRSTWVVFRSAAGAVASEPPGSSTFNSAAQQMEQMSADLVQQADGVLVPGGFGSRGIEGKILAIHYARENKVPYLGLCLGMQLMVVDFARFALDTEDANSTEFDRSTKNPVIDLMPDQRAIADMGGTMRLGLYPCHLQPGTRAAAAYAEEVVQERHRHRFEFNNAYRGSLGEAGMLFSGLSPDGRLVEIAELRDHPFMVGTQFHPEFLSRPNRPHPLFVAFLDAVRQRGYLAQKPDKLQTAEISVG